MGYLLAKNLNRVSDDLEIWHAKRFDGAQKKPENNVFVPGPVHCENGVLKYENICKFVFPLQIFEALF